MILMGVSCGFLGLAIGLTIAHDWKGYKKQKTLSELDEELKTELEKKTNLVESLLADVEYWRNRYHVLQKAKDERKNGS